jgi:signal peptidase I
VNRNAVVRFLLEIASVSIISVFLFILCFHYFLKPFRVEGMSMEPLLHEGDYILVRRFHSTPLVNRGDIVVVLPPDGGYAVKRIAAIAGDEISISSGELFVNNKSEGRIDFGADILNSLSGKMKIEKGYVFLLGDNRDKSLDSRVWGPVRVDDIYGKTIVLNGLESFSVLSAEKSK